MLRISQLTALTAALILLGIFGISCSSAPKKQNFESSKIPMAKTPEVIHLENQEMITEAKEVGELDKKELSKEFSKSLIEYVNEAKSTGQHAVDYLANDLFIKASDSSLREDSETAAHLFKHIMMLKPDDIYLKKRYAIELIRTGNLIDSRDILKELFKTSNYKSAPTGLVLGGIYTTLRNTKEARSVYQLVLKNNPGNEEACIFLAKSYALEKEYKKANSLLSNCAKKSKNKPIFSYYKGKIAVERNRIELAKKHFRKALSVRPDFYQAAIGLGLIYESKQQYKKVISVYTKFVKNNPPNYAVLSKLTNLLFTTGEFKRVIPYLEQLTNIDASNLNLKVKLGILYTDSKRYEDAKGVFKEVLKAVPNSDKVLYYTGSLHQQTGEFEKAISYFSRIAPDSPLFHESNIQIGYILQLFAKQDAVNNDSKGENIERFTNFVDEKSRKYKELRFELGKLLAGFYEGGEQYEQAIEALLKVKNEKGYDQDHDYYLASMYEKNGQVKVAQSIMRELLKKNPKNADALNFLGYSLLEEGKGMDEAYKYISKAIALKPDDGYIRDSLGWYYYKTGKLKKALVEIQKAWEKVKTDVVINKHLAIVYKGLKKYDKAKKYLVEALKNCRIESERNSVLKIMMELEGVRKKRLPASEGPQK